MATAKRTTFALTAEDIAVLEAVQRHAGVGSVTDAMRISIREYLRSRGLEVPKVKRSAPPK